MSDTAGVSSTTLLPPEPDRIANLVAFTRLVNYVRFFHPSDEAAGADWGRFVVENVEQVVEPADPETLAALLGGVIASVAPSTLVFPASDSPAPGSPTSVSCAGHQVTAWEHRGVHTADVVNDPMYTSQRITVDADPATWPEWFPDPSQPLRVDLGGGAAALIPLAVCVVDGATVPVSPGPDWLAQDPPAVAYGRYDPDDQETRLAAVILTWGFFQHFYPYWDVVDGDWNAALEEALHRVLEQPDMSLSEVLRRFVAHTDDGHAVVYGGSEDLAAPPIRWDWVEDQLVITDVRGSAVGLLAAGDVVVSVNGVPSQEAIAQAELLVAAASPSIAGGSP